MTTLTRDLPDVGLRLRIELPPEWAALPPEVALVTCTGPISVDGSAVAVAHLDAVLSDHGQPRPVAADVAAALHDAVVVHATSLATNIADDTLAEIQHVVGDDAQLHHTIVRYCYPVGLDVRVSVLVTCPASVPVAAVATCRDLIASLTVEDLPVEVP